MLEELLEIEKEGKILEFTFNRDRDMLIWPFIRYQVLSYVLSKKFNMLKPHASKDELSFRSRISYFFSLVLNPVFVLKRQYKVMSIGPSRTNILINKKYFNFLYDYYNFVLPEETIFFEVSHGEKIYRPKNFLNSYLFDSLEILPYIKSRIYISRDIRLDIIEYLKELTQKYDIEHEYYEKLSKFVINIYKRVRFFKNTIKKLLRKINPKILFINVASYGGMNSLIIKVAKDLGIKVGEFQHGLITKVHIAYNYGESIFKSDKYRKYLPDYLLTYGDFWNEQMNIPVKKVTIGNPHFWYNYRKYQMAKNKEEHSEDKKIILIVSQGSITDVYVKIAKELSERIDSNYRIIFRLHPGEVPFEERYKELDNYDNVEINKEGSIYDLIHRSDYIVSVYSTTIFEAIPFNKPVYIYKHPLSVLYIPRDLGIWFESVDELCNLIQRDIKQEKQYDINYFWNRNWKKNYINFLKNEVGIEVKRYSASLKGRTT